MKEFRLAVTGGRDFTDKKAVFSTLDKVNRKRPITLLIHGGARGADTLASSWATSRDVPQKAFYAEWDKYGRSAGMRRNREMLDNGKPHGVVGFPGGRGTAGMIKESHLRKITVYQPYRSN